MGKSHWAAGNINMKGKKHRQLSCRCCDVFDKRCEWDKRLFAREIELEVIEWQDNKGSTQT